MRLPIDDSFLSQVIYEGYLAYLRYGSILNAINELRNRVEGFRLTLTGNDLSMIKKTGPREGFPEKLLMLLSPSMKETLMARIKEKQNYKDLFDPNFLEDLANALNERDVKVSLDDIIFDIDSGKVIIGKLDSDNLKGKKKREESKMLAALQITKADRYTGFTSPESGLTSMQVTMYMTPEIALLTILGLMSSFVIGRGNSYYFLFFAPGEIQDLLCDSPETCPETQKDKIASYFYAKETFISELRRILRRISQGELILLELYINTNIHRAIESSGLNYLSLNLFRVDREGQTYKVYELIPIEYEKNRRFLKTIEKYFTDTDRTLGILQELLDPENSSLIQAVGSSKYAESDNALRALMGLYRFIFLDDVNGWWIFTRELWNCYNRLASGTKKEQSRARWYKYNLSRLT